MNFPSVFPISLNRQNARTVWNKMLLQGLLVADGSCVCFLFGAFEIMDSVLPATCRSSSSCLGSHAADLGKSARLVLPPRASGLCRPHKRLGNNTKWPEVAGSLLCVFWQGGRWVFCVKQFISWIATHLQVGLIAVLKASRSISISFPPPLPTRDLGQVC